jgi:hypothetical protein
VRSVKEGKAYKKIEAYGKAAEVRNRAKVLCIKKCNIKNTGKSRAKCVKGEEEYCKEKRLTVWNDSYYSVTMCVQNECCREKTAGGLCGVRRHCKTVTVGSAGASE